VDERGDVEKWTETTPAPQYLRRFALSVAPFSPNVSVSYQ
jgi:hypothetical protein